MLSKINKAMFGTKDVLNNFYCLFDDITDENAREVTEWILANNLAPVGEQPDVLNLMINSPGGSVSAGFAIIDMMRGSKIPVRTIGLGCVASSGLLIFMSGQKGYRVLAENTSILSHTFSGGNIGKSHDLLAMNVEYSNIQNRLTNHMAKCTGLTEKEVISKLMPASDIWLLPKEAVKLGLADSVSTLK